MQRLISHVSFLQLKMHRLDLYWPPHGPAVKDAMISACRPLRHAAEPYGDDRGKVYDGPLGRTPHQLQNRCYEKGAHPPAMSTSSPRSNPVRFSSNRVPACIAKPHGSPFWLLSTRPRISVCLVQSRCLLMALPGASLRCSDTAAIEASSDGLRAIRPQPSMIRSRL